MFEDLLSKLGSGSKEVVGISLNANGLLEIAQIDRGLHTVKKYTNSYVSYDAINREPASYSELAAQIEDAMTTIGIAKGTNVTFSLPNVLFGIQTLPDGISDDNINTSIVSIAEDSYLFKREEPIISWSKLSSENGVQKIAYSAIQQRVISEIKELCSKLGLNLISIQNVYSTLLQGLDFCEITERYETNNQVPWNILYISSSNYAIFNFKGNKLEEFYEEPLAIKSFSSDEVYSAVSSMAVPALRRFQTTKTIVISATDEISAEIISPQLGLVGDVEYIEQNRYQQMLNIDMSMSYEILEDMKSQVSLLAVGTGADHFQDKYVKFNLAAKSGISGIEQEDIITLGSTTIVMTKEKALKITIPIVLFIVIVGGFLYFIFNNMNTKSSEEVNNLIQEEKRLQDELKANSDKTTTVDVSASINEIVSANRKKLLYYDSLSYGIPPQLWIKYFYAGDSDAIGIHGAATDSTSIAAFLRGIREVAGESAVSVTKLQIEGNDEITTVNPNDPEIYSFELASPSYNPSGAPAASQKNTAQSKNLPPAGRPSKQPPLIKAD